ncbi:hypothetical protein PTKIN_Ptkin02bG0257400 [Pterospermum kingtungense]
MNKPLSSSSQWMPHYQPTIDTTTVTTSTNTSSCATSGSNYRLSPSSSYVAGEHLTPKSCMSKPIQKRSRASKKTPTTLLNADAKNFRSLVQQYTGCRRRSTSLSFGNPRGPIDINFAFGKENNYHSNDQVSTSQLFVDQNNVCYGQSQQEGHHQQQHYLQQEQVSNEEEESQFGFDSFTADDAFLLTSSCFPKTGSEISQGFVKDDLYFLA